jgi:Fe-S cluster biogenesis protein NfuA
VFAARATTEDMSEEDQARLAVISDLLDHHIRPSLQADGGDLHLVGLSGNYLSIHYQGACGSCPSSISGTLAAIQNLVRTVEADMSVVAV